MIDNHTVDELRAILPKWEEFDGEYGEAVWEYIEKTAESSDWLEMHDAARVAYGLAFNTEVERDSMIDAFLFGVIVATKEGCLRQFAKALGVESDMALEIAIDDEGEYPEMAGKPILERYELAKAEVASWNTSAKTRLTDGI